MTGLIFFLKIAKVLLKNRNIETIFLSAVHTAVERKRTGSKVLTFKQLTFHSKYLQTRSRKIIKSDLHENMYFFYLLHITCMIFIWKMKLSVVSTNYSNLSTQVCGWNLIKQKQIEQLTVQQISSVKQRQRIFVFTWQSSTLLSETFLLLKFCCMGEETQITHANISPQRKLVLGINDGEVDRNKKQNMSLETFSFQHFSIISCLTKTADTQKRPSVTESST